MTREEALLLLPFLANGTLAGEERASVEHWVAEDAALASELAALRRLRQTMRSEEMSEATPGEAGLTRLMAALPDARGTSPAASLPQPANANRPLIWQIAAAVMLALVFGQALVLAGRDAGGYELAGAERADFTLSVRPETSEGDLRALLLLAGVEIVSGPSSLGLYGLKVLEGGSAEEARRLLESRPELIESLESGR